MIKQTFVWNVVLLPVSIVAELGELISQLNPAWIVI